MRALGKPYFFIDSSRRSILTLSRLDREKQVRNRRLTSMEEESKGKTLSRRSFLKGIGGGAIGTAVISMGLLKSDRAEGYTRKRLA